VCCGQPEGEAGAAAGTVAVGGELAVVGMCDGPRDGQPDAAATVVLAGGIGPVEPLEDVGERLGGDAAAGVGDVDGDAVRGGVAAEGDRPARGGVAQGVVEEVGQHLPQAGGVAGDHRQIGREPVAQVDGGVLGLDLAGSQGSTHELGGVEKRRLEIEPPLLGARDQREVVHQPPEAAAGLLQGGPRVVGDDHAVLDPFEVGVEGGQWGAQLVRQVAEQPPTLVLGVLEGVGHVVEAGGEIGELVVVGVLWGADVEVAAGEPTNLTVVNDGDAFHDLTIDEVGLRIDVDSGQQATAGLEIDEPGEYEYYCSVPGHAGAGMRGTLTVTPP
jgi:hypothetical protein